MFCFLFSLGCLLSGCWGIMAPCRDGSFLLHLLRLHACGIQKGGPHRCSHWKQSPIITWHTGLRCPSLFLECEQGPCEGAVGRFSSLLIGFDASLVSLYAMLKTRRGRGIFSPHFSVRTGRSLMSGVAQPHGFHQVSDMIPELFRHQTASKDVPETHEREQEFGING